LLLSDRGFSEGASPVTPLICAKTSPPILFAPAALGAICPATIPPLSTVYNIFRKFQRDGAWEVIWEGPHVTLRDQLGWQAIPMATVIDSQTRKAAEILR
jgi:hypothetical protein